MRLQQTTFETFARHLDYARATFPHIGTATSPASELAKHADARWYVTPDHLSGFGVAPDGTLLGLHSQVRGRGPSLLREAEWLGATRLWCFDGFLVGLYERNGFVELERSPNWTPGGPDVVYMQRAQVQA